MFPVTRLYTPWLKVRNFSTAAMEDKALGKQYEATSSVLTTKGRFRNREVILGQLRVSLYSTPLLYAAYSSVYRVRVDIDTLLPCRK